MLLLWFSLLYGWEYIARRSICTINGAISGTIGVGGDGVADCEGDVAVVVVGKKRTRPTAARIT